MMTREEKIFNLPFFQDKRDLARQVLHFEQTLHTYLPNEFEIKQIPPYDFGEKQAALGRIAHFYFIGICNQEQEGWKYQAFENEMKCKEFFINLPNIDEKQLAFWFNTMELLAA
ncbi:DUF3964 family protein [Microbacteriaceae bacterium 4G12]